MKPKNMNYKDPKILNNKYIIKQELSSGSFGVVYLAFDKLTKEEVAVKLEKEENEDVGTLEREVEIFQKLGLIKGVPVLYWHGSEQNYNVIVMSLLGKDTAHYMKTYKKLPLKTVLQMAKQLVSIMERVHISGVIHRDLKPENLMVGRDDTSNMFIVDFGVSKIYLDENKKHIPFKDKKSFIGTTRYASIAAHKGHELGRRDDLESLFYVIIYFLKGRLPWQNLQNIGNKDRSEVVGDFKQKISVSELCRDLPSNFIFILNYLKTLEYKSQPNYSLIQLQLQKTADTSDIILDQIYEWSEKIKPMEEINKISSQKKILSQDIKIDSLQNVEQKIKDQVLWAVSDTKQGLLQLPEPKNGHQRSESKHQSQCSIQGSYSSMQIKYVPSRFDGDTSNQKDVIKDNQSQKQFLQLQTHQITRPNMLSQQQIKSNIPNQKQKTHNSEHNQLNEQQQQDPHETNLYKKTHTLDSTWGCNDMDMEEYKGDSPKLGQKLLNLQRQSVEVQKFLHIKEIQLNFQG